MTRQQSLILGPVLLIVIGGIASFFFINRSNQIVTDPPVVDVPVKTTKVGEYSCLPNKKTGGPTTLECALGIKADDGYYALDMTTQSPELATTLQTGQQISVTGMLVPIEQLSSDHLFIRTSPTNLSHCRDRCSSRSSC